MNRLTEIDSPDLFRQMERLCIQNPHPSITSPSTGTLSPGFTTTVSFLIISALGILSSLPSRITVALGGTRSNSARRESDVPFRDLISIQWPNRTKVTNKAAAS